MRLLTLALAAIGALVALTLALTSPAPAPARAPAPDRCEEELRVCRAAGDQVAQRVLRCLTAEP